MNIKKESPVLDDPRNASYNFKDTFNEPMQNTDLFNSFIKKTEFKQEFRGTLWAEGPCYIPHKNMLVWSDIPNNRMMKLVNGQVSEFLRPSNFCNGNTIDNDENLISCSHGGRCIYKTEDNLNRSILVEKFEGKSRAYIEIQQGCDHRCTFCIIPFGRGNSRSTTMITAVLNF